MSSARRADLSGPAVSVRRETRRGWLPPARQISAWAKAALGARAAGTQLSVALVGPARSRALNARYRGRDQPTNVLSFPALPSTQREAGMLGDLVICPAVLRAEARAQRKRPQDHWAHLVVHGVLHLIGYDHELELEAQRMERREIRTLRALGVANPYRVSATAARATSRARA